MLNILEEKVINSLLLNDHYLAELDENMFHYHKITFREIKGMYESHGELDISLLYEKTGGRVGELGGEYATRATVEEFKKRSKLFRIQRSVKEKLSEEIKEPDELALSLIGELEELIKDTKVDYTDDFDSVSEKAIAELKSAENPSEREKYMFGMEYLDYAMFGLHKSELTAIAAHSGVGKTAFAIQVAYRLAEKGLKVLFLSREMNSSELFYRVATHKLKIDGMKFRRKSFTKREWDSIHGFKEQYASLKLHLDDKTSTVDGVRKRLLREHFDVVFCDYVQIMTPDLNMNNREREVAGISRSLKSLSQEFEIPVITLSQLNNESNGRRPSGERDMRESKAIFQDSNNVIFIHHPKEGERDTYIGKELKGFRVEEDDFEHEDYKLVEVIVSKQRSGITGISLMKYWKRYLTFEEIESSEPKMLELKTTRVSENYVKGDEIPF